MKFNRLISLPLVGFAVIAALSGCGGNSVNPVAVEPQFDTTPPPAPVNLALSADASGNPMLVWDASAAPDVASYEVQVYSAYDGGFVRASDPTAGDTSFPLQDAQASYRVRAVDTSGNWSGFSATANVLVPQAGQPASIEIE